MNQAKFSILIIIVLLNSIFLSGKLINVEPINVNNKLIESLDKHFIIGSSHGVIKISNDNGSSWEQIKPFNSGVTYPILKNDFCLLFNSNGEIARLFYSTNKVIIEKDLKLKILAVIQFNNNFFIRTLENFLILDSNFSILNSYKFNSRVLNGFDTEDYYYSPFDYRHSIVRFQNNLIVELDNSIFVTFDLNLNNPRIINDFKKDIDKSYYQLFADTNYCFFKINVDDQGTIIQTNDFKSFNKVFKSYDYFKYKKIDDQIYLNFDYDSLLYSMDKVKFSIYKLNNQNTLSKVTELKNKFLIRNFGLNDFLIKENRIFIVDRSSALTINNLTDSIINFISKINWINQCSTPFIINDSTFLFTEQYNIAVKYNRLDYTNNLMKTFKPLPLDSNFLLYKSVDDFAFQYNDYLNNRIIMAGKNIATKTPTIIEIKNNLKTVTEKKFKEDLFFHNYSYYIISEYSNIFKFKNYFYYGQYPGNYTQQIIRFDNNFDIVDRKSISSSAFFDYIGVVSDSSFFYHSIDFWSGNQLFRYTSDNFTTSDTLKFYDKFSLAKHYKEIIYNGIRYVAFFNYNYKEKELNVNLFNFKDRTLKEIYNCKTTYDRYIIDFVSPESLTMDNVNIYLSINDTLFIIKNLYNRDTWDYVILPNSGKIRENSIRLGSRIFAAYEDSLNPRTACWLTLYDISRPKPTILANDCSFESIKIDKGISSRRIRIENLSTEKDLIISGYSGITESVFTTELPQFTSSNPLIIKPLEKYYFNVYFNPKEIKNYNDSIVFISNADSLDNITYLYGSVFDSTLSDINEPITEIQNYLYAFPAYPVPSNTGFVKSLIYWDTSIDIDKAKITITNLNGEIINTDHKLSIEKNNNFNGNLIWDCRNMPSGAYFIKIEHGSALVTLKVMVD